MSSMGDFIRWTEQFAAVDPERPHTRDVRRHPALASVLMAFIGYHVPYSLAAIAMIMGFKPFGVAPLAYLYLFIVIINILAYTLILRVRRISQRFIYWQTVFQLAAWLVMFTLYTLLMAEHRAVALVCALMTCAFVALIGNWKEGLILCVSASLSYLLAIAVAYTWFDQPIDVVSETLFLGAFIFVSLYLTMMGSTMRLSRDKARQTKLSLQKTQAELSEVMSQLERRARTDELTGLHNRRHGREVLGALQLALETQSSAATVMLLDIDNFKAINDNYGHDTGDAVLKTVAKTLATLKRDDDLLARWGGEEFLIAWPRTALPAAAIIADRLRQAVEELAIDADSARIHITFSAGLAELKPGASLNDIIKKADDRLYEAKRTGRNRVCYQS
ncbi:diguanylate cyclase [Allohahella marinimesophila]|uniref:diguanylate cyclase n=1 Tax=Allohahella marinimesophila TaxID=1054972 RepID=A0ABP7Q3I2_9GAMM